MLRTVAANGRSKNNFKWPKRGKVVAPDWDPIAECGGGLHGALWGVGDGSLFDWSKDALWQVVRIDGDMVDLRGKIKIEKGYVVFTGSRQEATQKIRKLGAQGKPVIGNVESAGDNETVSGGDWSTISGGDNSTVSGGWRSIVSGGERSTLSGGGDSIVSGGDGSMLFGGDRSTVSGGSDSIVSGRDGSMLFGGKGSKVSGGESSILILQYYDDRSRSVTAYVGENGIEPNIFYRLNEKHEFEEVE